MINSQKLAESEFLVDTGTHLHKLVPSGFEDSGEVVWSELIYNSSSGEWEFDSEIYWETVIKMTSNTLYKTYSSNSDFFKVR